MSAGQKPKILIIGGFTFSHGEAGSNVVIGLGRAIEEAGYCVEYLAEDRGGAAVREDFRRFTCHLAPAGPALQGWRSALVNLSASNHSVINWLGHTLVPGVHAVIVYPGGDFQVAALAKLSRLCLARSWKLAVVVTEWQAYWRLDKLKLSHRVLATVDSEIQRRFQYKKIHHVIVISKFLERYYNNSGCHAILVPPLIDASAEKWNCRPPVNSDKRGVKLVFSGGWWRDRLDLMTEAVLQLKNEGHDVVLEFLGPRLDEIEQDPQLLKQMRKAPNGTFRFHGKVPLEKLFPMTSSADFGVMLRERAKWSNACFPSKVAEFQALGVPMLCNLTSDLETPLRDGENALIVPSVSVAALATTIKRALGLTPTERERLRQHSLQCATKHFDYRNYVDPLGEFIRGI